MVFRRAFNALEWWLRWCLGVFVEFRGVFAQQYAQYSQFAQYAQMAQQTGGQVRRFGVFSWCAVVCRRFLMMRWSGGYVVFRSFGWCLGLFVEFRGVFAQQYAQYSQFAQYAQMAQQTGGQVRRFGVFSWCAVVFRR